MASIGKTVGAGRGLLSLVGLLALTAGCPSGGCRSGDAGTVRRSALVPGPQVPARLGPALPAGRGRASVEATGIYLIDYAYDAGRLGDPGRVTPSVHVGASGHVGVTGFLELGARVRYAEQAWAVPFADDLPRAPRRRLWDGGPGARLNLPLFEHAQRRFGLSWVAELNVAKVAEAVWEDTDNGLVRRAVQEQWFYLPNTALLLWVDDGRAHLTGMLGVQQNVTNVGYDEREHLLADTLSAFPVVYGGLGMELRAGWGGFAGAYLTMHAHAAHEVSIGPRAHVMAGFGF